MTKIFFDNWESLYRTFFITIMAYFALIFLLRISGKRSLSKMNAFDFIITVALGSTLATVLLNKSVALADGVLAFALLIGLQYIITFLAVRSKKVSHLVKATPALIVYDGEILKDIMIKERVNEDEIYAVLRENGISSIKKAKAVILETDGSLSVISSTGETRPETLKTVSP
ncbi:MAG: DUF421 domain-containing protein [Lentimicrobium sp.]|jgi:uncharacterized membrane protein YcaP (DUF421 family)|nr:DUF421 domain-containing protein [Lentimicrobium sp.]MDD2528061.1 DUF421 domain-containing protein [Lentimicrobiaceae bacterium]MDD4597690.1 DUF421 domain-containing protein [Lentimicrobiaceae bacterium]MDY0027314.1 DUF421 domain-containing protein [Lentimicrobium sp.]